MHQIYSSTEPIFTLQKITIIANIPGKQLIVLWPFIPKLVLFTHISHAKLRAKPAPENNFTMIK